MKDVTCDIDPLSARPWSERRDCRPPAVRLRSRSSIRRVTAALGVMALSTALSPLALASDHLDSPATVANPEADIADVYAWTSPEGRQLNLVMTIQGHTFSDKVKYVLHIDSGRVFGRTSSSTSIVCSLNSTCASMSASVVLM